MQLFNNIPAIDTILDEQMEMIISHDQHITEYECDCGYVWLDTENNGCELCGTQNNISERPYITIQPSKYYGK